jgi:hypothetical protein
MRSIIVVSPKPGVPANTPLEDAFKLYLDYDGRGSRITGDSVRTTSAISDAVGAYTVVAAGGKTYVLLFNKDSATRSVDVAGQFKATDSAQVYRFDVNNCLALSGKSRRQQKAST